MEEAQKMIEETCKVKSPHTGNVCDREGTHKLHWYHQKNKPYYYEEWEE